MTAISEQALTSGGSWSAWPLTAEMYRFSLRLGARALLPFGWRAALPRLLNPLAYPRGMEFALVLRGLDPPEQGQVLDVASPKLLFLWLASNTRLQLTATDIRGDFIAPTRYLVGRLGLAGEIGQRLALETQDARILRLRSGSFDAAYSVSVIEHIPESGDSMAMQEIARVLRPGARFALTVPYSPSYEEEWVTHDVFERKRRRGQKQVFFQRRYDNEALERRLIAPSGLREIERAYFGETGIRFDRRWNRLPQAARLPFAWAQPFFERAFLCELPAEEKEKAIGVALTLSKEGAAESDR